MLFIIVSLQPDKGFSMWPSVYSKPQIIFSSSKERWPPGGAVVTAQTCVYYYWIVHILNTFCLIWKYGGMWTPLLIFLQWWKLTKYLLSTVLMYNWGTCNWGLSNIPHSGITLQKPYFLKTSGHICQCSKIINALNIKMLFTCTGDKYLIIYDSAGSLWVLIGCWYLK